MATKYCGICRDELSDELGNTIQDKDGQESEICWGCAYEIHIESQQEEQQEAIDMALEVLARACR